MVGNEFVFCFIFSYLYGHMDFIFSNKFIIFHHFYFALRFCLFRFSFFVVVFRWGGQGSLYS